MISKYSKLWCASLLLVLSGCAQQASIDVPAVQSTYVPEWENKYFTTEVLYSQPMPGIISGGEQIDYVPLDEATFSIASSKVMSKFNDYITQQLPKGVMFTTEDQYDYKLLVKLKARHKKGPTYPDHDFTESLGKGLLTFGFAPQEYTIVADFDVQYSLQHSSGKVVLEKSYVIEDDVSHERGRTESMSTTYDYAAQLLERHLILSLSDFVKEAATKRDSYVTLE